MFFFFNLCSPLHSIIQDLCKNWSLSDFQNYELKYSENNERYVTEKNRHEVKNGSVLRLKHSALKATQDILVVLKQGSTIEKTKCLENMSRLSSDPTFAIEFIKEQGLNSIIKMIEDEKCIGEMLKFALLSFVELMDHGTVSFDILQPVFVMRNIQFINNPSLIAKEIIMSALMILENIVQNSFNSTLVEKHVTFDNLLKLLQDSSSQAIQQNTVALMNALFIKADESRKKQIAATFSTKQYRNVFLLSVLNNEIGTEMAHQLSVLQTLTLGLLDHRKNTVMNAQDQEAMDKIKELRRIAFEGEGLEQTLDVTGRKQATVHYKKLGFKYDINPGQDFMEAPGLLALDCMIYFARNFTQAYTKVVHENSCRSDEHEFFFGRCSIELVKLLCDILHIGEPFETGKDFHPIFFTHDHPFEEFFCICIVVLNKTWKDMRATNEDFLKVFSVVKEQITRSLKTKPRNLEDFKTKIGQLTYAKITALRQQERTSREECESTASAIVNLKEKIKPEIEDLIRQQRLGYLVEGTRFSKYNRGVRSKEKFWYVRLSPNHKVLHYGDCDEKTVPTLEELKNKLEVSEIKQLLIGKECPLFREMKSRNKTTTLFSITFDSGEQQTLDFVAPDEQTFDFWTDGKFLALFFSHFLSFSHFFLYYDTIFLSFRSQRSTESKDDEQTERR